VLNAEGKLPGTILQDKTLGAAQLADGAVTADKVAAGAVGNPQLAANAVGQANIAAGSIRREHVYDNQIITGHLDNNAVTSAKIADGAIDIQDIKDGAVIDAKISGVAAGKISGQVGTAQIADGAVTARKAKLGAWTTGIIGAGWTYSDYVGASYWQEIAFPGASLTISLETTSVVLMLFKCTIALKSGDRGNPDFVCSDLLTCPPAGMLHLVRVFHAEQQPVTRLREGRVGGVDGRAEPGQGASEAGGAQGLEEHLHQVIGDA